MFRFSEESHAVRAESVGTDVTRSALASLRLAIKAYFETYYVCNKNNIILPASPSDPSDPFHEYEMDQIEALCNKLDYQEKYMQCIFHFHHFFELFLKDLLKTKHPYLALKLSLDSRNAELILNIINNRVTPEHVIHDNTVEFGLALDRVHSLRSNDSVANIIAQYKGTLEDLNLLRNRAWHRGLLILRIDALDTFISKNVFPLLLKLMETSNYKGKERYWKYNQADLDPIEKIVEHSTENYKALLFFKAYGNACYNLPSKFNLDLHDTLSKAKAIVDSIPNLELHECLVCKESTLLVSTEHDVDTDTEGRPVAAWWNTTAAECLNCRFTIYPDVGEPTEYGVGSQLLWETGSHSFDD